MKKSSLVRFGLPFLAAAGFTIVLRGLESGIQNLIRILTAF
mgnify:CR=1 FL=1|jgi:hypothetical protein